MDCTWNSPGVDPYRGTVAEAVARYNLPIAVANELVYKAESLNPDAVLTIRRDSAVSTTGDSYRITDMHYGKARVCAGEVDRSLWPPEHVENALVYCAAGTCIAVPLICHNVSLLTHAGTAPSPNDWLKNSPAAMAPANTVPEPGVLVMLGTALAAMWFSMRGKR